jgi:hypothetical protein
VTLSGGGVRRILQITNTQNQAYSITLQNIAFANGSTPTGRGAAIFKETGGPWQAVSLKLVNCGFRDNTAMMRGQDDGGGALYATGMDHVQIANCTFSGNRGSNGGAVYSLGSRRVTVADSLFSANQATGTGGNPGSGGNAGALGIDGSARLVDVCRTCFLGNTSNAYGSGFFSVMQWPASRPAGGGAETQATPSTVFVDPLLALSEADNGGHVPTLAIDGASPARDSGVATAVVPATDARCAARVGAPDRGSFEYRDPVTIGIGNAAVGEGDPGTAAGR